MTELIPDDLYEAAVMLDTSDDAKMALQKLIAFVVANGVPGPEAEKIVKTGLERFARLCGPNIYARTLRLFALSVPVTFVQANQQKKTMLLKQLEDGNYTQELLETDISQLALWRKELGEMADFDSETAMPKEVH